MELEVNASVVSGIQSGVFWFKLSVLELLNNLCLSLDNSFGDRHWMSFQKVVFDTDLEKLQGF